MDEHCASGMRIFAGHVSVLEHNRHRTSLRAQTAARWRYKTLSRHFKISCWKGKWHQMGTRSAEQVYTGFKRKYQQQRKRQSTCK